MKSIKWKFLIITCIVCILPIFFGLWLWKDLPDSIAIHFNFNNQPDNFVSKEFAVFGLPLIMAAFQIICCAATDLSKNKTGTPKKFELITKWILPVISIILQFITLGYALGLNIDIRKSTVTLIGIIFIVAGSTLPSLDYVKK